MSEACTTEELEIKFHELDTRTAVLDASLKRDIEYLRNQMKLEFAGKDVALVLQTKEIERRLEILNGEAGRIKDNQDKSVLREVYTSDQKANKEAVESARSYAENKLEVMRRDTEKALDKMSADIASLRESRVAVVGQTALADQKFVGLEKVVQPYQSLANDILKWVVMLAIGGGLTFAFLNK